mgnify:CR=1 FL=1
MLPREGSRGPATGRADDEPFPHEERFGDRLDGVGLLPHGNGEVGHSDRTAAEAPAERVEHGPVEPVQAADVDVEEGQRLVGRVKVDDVLTCLLYTSPSPRDRTRSRMPSSA